VVDRLDAEVGEEGGQPGIGPVVEHHERGVHADRPVVLGHLDGVGVPASPVLALEQGHLGDVPHVVGGREPGHSGPDDCHSVAHVSPLTALYD
jgi:hypothetical protein